jgi:excisionase family DNA binding protein
MGIAEFTDQTTSLADHERALAQEASLRLGQLLAVQPAAATVIFDPDNPRAGIALPAAALGLLRQVLDELAKGNLVTVVPHDAELSTQQAADLLRVSRPFVIKLVDEGRIPCRKVGLHRRIRLADVLRFKQENERERNAALEQLQSEAQALNLGY